jgi:succinoglycan biosynthesis protein ExoO
MSDPPPAPSAAAPSPAAPSPAVSVPAVSVPAVSVPAVSVIVANYNAAAFVEAALRSVLAQSLTDIEVIVADDASTDDGPALIAAIAARDPRVRLLRAQANGGPAAARNRCLDAARGRWIAIMDSDDLMHPRRLERLVRAAEADGADIAADDLLIFHQDGAAAPETCLRGEAAAFWVDAAAYVRANVLFSGAAARGVLKPLIRTALIQHHRLRYDTSLRIAEDYDFLLRLLARGARFRVFPDLTYFYRKHGASISHRLSRRTVAPMLLAHDALRAQLGGNDRALDRDLDAAMALRRASLQRALDFDDLVAALKRRDWRATLAMAWRRPRVAAQLRGPLIDRLRRLLAGRPPRSAGARRQICVLSRQRVVGNTNGSSVYLLSLCAALAQDGAALHLVCPSPVVFGRWPAMLLQPEMAVFRSIRVRGAIRIGRALVATDPRIACRAALAVAARVVARVVPSLGAAAGRFARPAPYAVSQPWRRRDFLFVARHARPHADVVIADYAFLTEGIPYTLRPDAPSAVVMHDLFSSRSAQFARLGAADSVALIDADAEFALLGDADAVIAIQPEEAAIVQARLPHRRVICAPIAVRAVAAAQPGHGCTVLFVGSNTAPNIVGLRWFNDAIWPLVRQAVPDATLLVAGTVCGAIADVPQGVRLLGRVADLGALYRDSAVVVSPLQAGSGLKIKLIEALGHGKAVVATSTTLQGVDRLVGQAIMVADSADAFAAATIALLRDDALRAGYAADALAAAQAGFSAAACYAALLDFTRVAPSLPHAADAAP